MEDRCLGPGREDFPSHSGSHLLCDLGQVFFTSAARMLPRCNWTAGTPMAMQGPGLALGTGWGGWLVSLRSAGCMYPPCRRLLHLQGAKKQSKKVISRKKPQICQPSSCITWLARNKMLEGKKIQGKQAKEQPFPITSFCSGLLLVGVSGNF